MKPFFKIMIGPVLSLVLLSGCSQFESQTGKPEEQGLLNAVSTSGPRDETRPLTMDPQGKFTCSHPEARGLSARNMRRLTKSELIATLTDLLGATVMNDGAIQIQLQSLPDDVVRDAVTDVAPSPADNQPMSLLNIANRAGEVVLANASIQSKIYGACSALSPVTVECARNFIETFGSLVYRRPLSPAEITQFFAQFSATGGVEGLTRLLIRFLLAPSLAFHVEVGTSVVDQRVRLTDFEVASRISYSLTGTMPDAELLAAARNHELKDIAGVKAQADRILHSHPKAKNKVSDFFRYYSKTDQISVPYAGAAKLLGISETGLDTEMIQETNEFISNIIWSKNGTVKDLFTSREVFPRSDRMAKILETSKASGNTSSLTSPEHAGLLLRPGFFATSEETTQPYHRAFVVRSSFLCETLGTPDPQAVAARMDTVGDLSQLSNRDQLAALTNAPQCLACHAKLNPVGFVFEGYDQLGARRALESVFKGDGSVAKTFPIDTKVGRTFIRDASGQEIMAFNDALDLVNAVSGGMSVNGCFAKKVFEFQRLRVATAFDDCAMTDLQNISATQGTILDVFLNSIANEDVFWKARGM